MLLLQVSAMNNDRNQDIFRTMIEILFHLFAKACRLSCRRLEFYTFLEEKLFSLYQFFDESSILELSKLLEDFEPNSHLVFHVLRLKRQIISPWILNFELSETSLNSLLKQGVIVDHSNVLPQPLIDNKVFECLFSRLTKSLSFCKIARSIMPYFSKVLKIQN